MKTIPPLLPAFALLAAALLPSCISWDIGGHLRDMQTRYTGVDVAHPVDGKLYRPADSRESCYYVTAPEITYTFAWPAMQNGWGMQVVMPAPGDVRPTGRLVTAKVGPAPEGVSGWQPQATEIAALPRGVHAEELPRDQRAPHSPACLAASRRKPGLARRALIGTCDYVVDPLLNVITPPVEVACTIAAVPFLAIYSLFDSDSQQAVVTETPQP